MWNYVSVWIIAFLLFACGGLLLFKLLLKPLYQKHHNELVLMVFGFTGTLFSLLVAFVMVNVWGSWDKMNEDINNEANALSNMYIYTYHLPTSFKDPLRKAIKNYTQSIINDEWSSMEQEKESPKTLLCFLELRKTFHTLYNLKGDEREIYTAMYPLWTTLSDLRRTRLNIHESNVPDMVWKILVASCVLTILISFFYVSENLILHTVLNGFIAIMFSFTLFLCYDLDHPFKGESRISHEPFQLLLDVQYKISDTN
jgi:branched-subunit amino acid ABC-type transport system permease component